jgi:putative sugar O-methyltransferase
MQSTMKITGDSKNLICDDEYLLYTISRGTESQKKIYKPGPYWLKKSKSAKKEIRRFGLSNFRGNTNSIANSYGDNSEIDTRVRNRTGVRAIFSKIFRDLYPFNAFFSDQVALTKNYCNEVIELQDLILKKNDRVKILLSKYNLDFETTRGGCLRIVDLAGFKVSSYYLSLLNTLDYINFEAEIFKRKSYFEIGAGFGANPHLLIELFGVRKIILLDISPNLYVATQYLKSFYGESVIDYQKSKEMNSITFSNDNRLEIFCILPEQIEKIGSEIDLFHNAHSFAEMTEDIIENYAKRIDRVMAKSGFISLVSYDYHVPGVTIHPSNISKFFSGKFERKDFPKVLENEGSNYVHFYSHSIVPGGLDVTS